MPAEVGFYKQYKTGRSNNYDIYVLFVEKGLSLLNGKGLLGFILPNKFMHQEYGKNLRLIISDNKNLMKLLNFKDFQVFEGATTYTCLLFLSKEPREYNLIGLYKNTGRTIADSLFKVVFERNSNSKIDSKPWNFCDIEEQKIMDKLQNYPPLNNIADNIFVGLQTSADKIYHLEQIGEKEHHYMVQSKSTGDKVELEKTILKPLISGVDVKRYTTPEIKTRIIFPYTIQSGKFTLINEKTLKKEFPLLHQYLLEYKKILGNREKGKFKGSEWYRFGRNQNIDKQHFKKICVPRLVKRIQAILDLNGTYYLDNVDVGGLTLKDDSDNNYKYILALLNSKLLSFYLTRISTPFRGGFYSCNKQYLSKLPIRTINFSNPAEKAQHDKLVALVESMLELQKKHHETRMECDKELYERQIKIKDAQIDRLVYDLYGLTEEEVKVVEGER
ncbi:hypothetical protein C5S29_06200 [ANME-1 cluster archaeon GoMg3.2]|nr:hypothetical protein [ANME-1 cluster archaeon GoMg3.2]